MSTIPPTDTHHGFIPRHEFHQTQGLNSSYSILALSGSSLLRLYGFPSDTLRSLRRHLDMDRLILSSRELAQEHLCEFTLDEKPWSNPKSTRSEKLLMDILVILCYNDHHFLSTLDYGREKDDHILMVFSRPSQPSWPPRSPSAFGSTSPTLFAISIISQNLLRVIAPPLHFTPAILQAVRGSSRRGIVSEVKIAHNVYEFKFKWFQGNTVEIDLLRQCFSLLSSLGVFGFTLLTSLSVNDRSRFKDLWVFTGPSYTLSSSASDLVPTPRELPRVGPQSSTGNAIDMTSIDTRNVGRTGVTDIKSYSNVHIFPPEESRTRPPSWIESVVDMTGIGTQKYGRTGGPDMNPYPQAPFKPHNISPDSVIRYSSTPVMKAPQYDEPSQGAQPLKEPTVMMRASTPLLPPSPQQAISQSGTSTPPLSPRGSRDSAFSSDTYQSADMSTSWAGIGKENDYVNSSPGTYDPEENALLDGWNPGQANITESTFPGGGYPSDLTAYNRTFGFPVGLTTEEREVRVGAAELVHPKHRLVRGGRAELIAEGSREDIYGVMGTGRLDSPIRSKRKEGDNDPPTAPIEGWVRVNVAQPGLSTPSASQNSRPSSQLSLQSKSSSLRPPMPPQKPPFARNLDSGAQRGGRKQVDSSGSKAKSSLFSWNRRTTMMRNVRGEEEEDSSIFTRGSVSTLGSSGPGAKWSAVPRESTGTRDVRGTPRTREGVGRPSFRPTSSSLSIELRM